MSQFKYKLKERNLKRPKLLASRKINKIKKIKSKASI